MKKIYAFILIIISVSFSNAQTAYVPNYSNNNVFVINVSTNTITDTIPVGLNPCGVSVSPDGTKVYITNTGDNNGEQ